MIVRSTKTVVARVCAAWTILAIALGSAACAPAESTGDAATPTLDTTTVDSAADEAAVRQRAMEWAAVEASNDDSASVSYMWEDAVMQPPGAPQVEGHEAILQLYRSVTFASLEVRDLEVAVGGDLAAVWGQLDYTLETPDGPVADQGKFVAVWERRDGVWKVLENTWNSNSSP